MCFAPHHLLRLRRKIFGLLFFVQLLAFAAGPWFATWAAAPGGVTGYLTKMKGAYAELDQYQCEIEVREYRKGRQDSLKRFLYSFKKPDRVRIDMLSPYRGMTLVYPDKKGKVLVEPGGPLGFLKLHLSPDNSLLKSSGGQRMNQTDLGRLIGNIERSLTEWRRGEPAVREREDRIVIEVLSRDHFLPDVETLYRFHLDKKLWLPVEIEELTPQGIPKRTTFFRDLHGTSLPKDFFKTK